MLLTMTVELLQSMVAKAVKGASCNKMIPLTSLMAIQCKENKLTLITTDATNYLYVTEDKIDAEDFYVVVPVEQFSKLISKMTCTSVVLEVADGVLEINGNGHYKMELPLDEEGEPVKYPDPLNSLPIPPEEFSSESVKLSTMKLILNTAKAALAPTDSEVMCYKGYYIGDKVITSDSYKICGINIPVFKEPVLLSPEMIDLLAVFSDEDIIVHRWIKEGVIAFISPKCCVYGAEMDCIGDFQVGPITSFLEQEFDSSCRIPRADLLQALDRLALFVSPYDKNVITLTFSQQGVTISSKKTTGSETIPYVESNNFKAFTCPLDIEMFRAQVKASSADMVDIEYGEDNAIKMKDGNVIQIVATAED